MIAHGCDLVQITVLQSYFRQRGSFSECNNCRHILRASTTGALVASTVKHRLKRRSLLHIECADALWCVHLVSGDRQEIASDVGNAHWNLACGLNGIGMKVDIGFDRNAPDLGHRLQYSGLVVRHHDGNQLRVRTKSLAHVYRIDKSTTINRKIRNLSALLLEVFARVQNGVMFDGGRYNVLAGSDQSE